MSSPDRRTILLVDDTPANRQLLSYWLTAAGYDVLEASNGPDGLRFVEERQPDLAVVDVQLPVMSGLEVCQRIRADPRTAAMPVLQTSAVAIVDDNLVRSPKGGADAHLTLPVERDEFLAVIRTLLR